MRIVVFVVFVGVPYVLKLPYSCHKVVGSESGSPLYGVYRADIGT